MSVGSREDTDTITLVCLTVKKHSAPWQKDIYASPNLSELSRYFDSGDDPGYCRDVSRLISVEINRCTRVRAA